MVNIILMQPSKLQINWVCWRSSLLSRCAEIVTPGEYMNKGDRNVHCFSQFKKQLRQGRAELGFVQASCYRLYWNMCAQISKNIQHVLIDKHIHESTYKANLH